MKLTVNTCNAVYFESRMRENRVYGLTRGKGKQFGFPFATLPRKHFLAKALRALRKNAAIGSNSLRTTLFENIIL